MKLIGDMMENGVVEIPLNNVPKPKAFRTAWYAYVRAHQHEINRLEQRIFKTKKGSPDATIIMRNARATIRSLEVRLNSIKTYTVYVGGNSVRFVSKADDANYATIRDQLNNIAAATGALNQLPLSQSLDTLDTPPTFEPDRGALDEFLHSHQQQSPRDNE